LLEEHGVPAAEVRTPAVAVRDPRVRDRGETVALDHPEFGRVADVIGMGVPITFSDASVGARRPAPSVGQDNALVYGDWLEYGKARLDALHADGVI
jgi:crotonobetainyl-CoA:carnitine CoA-transferase CaiB-like acyl-CoA transferase